MLSPLAICSLVLDPLSGNQFSSSTLIVSGLPSLAYPPWCSKTAYFLVLTGGTVYRMLAKCFPIKGLCDACFIDRQTDA